MQRGILTCRQGHLSLLVVAAEGSSTSGLKPPFHGLCPKVVGCLSCWPCQAAAWYIALLFMQHTASLHAAQCAATAPLPCSTLKSMASIQLHSCRSILLLYVHALVHGRSWVGHLVVDHEVCRYCML
jgi:hypothetical protein